MDESQIIKELWATQALLLALVSASRCGQPGKPSEWFDEVRLSMGLPALRESPPEA